MSPAKLMYTITLERKDVPAAYIDFMNTQVDKLRRFINMYHAVKKK